MSLRLKPGTILNCLQALIHGQSIVQFDPLAGVPHEREGKLAVTGVLHAGELRLERAGEDRDEVAFRAKPFGRDVGDVVVPVERLVWTLALLSSYRPAPPHESPRLRRSSHLNLIEMGLGMSPP